MRRIMLRVLLALVLPIGAHAQTGIFWTDEDSGKIQRANLDGSNVQDLITGSLSSPQQIALDVAGGKMYWVDEDTSKVQRANLDGTNVEDLVTSGLEDPEGIALLTGPIGPVGVKAPAVSPLGLLLLAALLGTIGIILTESTAARARRV